MHQHELRILLQKEDYNKPYQVVRGFNTSWWHRRAGRVDATIRDSKEYLQFLVNGTEVGRAEVVDCQLAADYDGIDTPITTKEITFLRYVMMFGVVATGQLSLSALPSVIPELQLLHFQRMLTYFGRVSDGYTSDAKMERDGPIGGVYLFRSQSATNCSDPAYTQFLSKQLQ